MKTDPQAIAGAEMRFWWSRLHHALMPDYNRLTTAYWWLTVLPGSCIMGMVLSANLLGDWLRVKLDPQLRQL